MILCGCCGFAIVSPADLGFFRHQGAGLLSLAFQHGTFNRLMPAMITELEHGPAHRPTAPAAAGKRDRRAFHVHAIRPPLNSRMAVQWRHIESMRRVEHR
jgi:hypothetical protein